MTLLIFSLSLSDTLGLKVFLFTTISGLPSGPKPEMGDSE
jgi:hypothetical protein